MGSRLDELAARLVLLDDHDDEGIAELVGELRAAAAASDDTRVVSSILPAADAVTTTTGPARIAALARLRQVVADAHQAAKPPIILFSEADKELFGEFVEESRRNLSDAEAALLALESSPHDREAIATVFRAFHTIKGTAAFLALDEVSRFAHAAENLLSQMRAGEVHCVGRNANLALRSIDILRAFIEEVAQSSRSGLPPSPPPEAIALTIELARPDKPDAAGEAFSSMMPVDETTREATRGRSGEESTWMRVRTERLDRLIDVVGELVIAQSMVSQDPSVAQGEREDLRRKVGHAAKIVRELQGLSMSLRMVPLKPTFQKLTRLVRDLARRTGKDVRFATEGDDTEIDRNMVDTIADPLVHMIRNAIDHGLEDPKVRLEAGKPIHGTVTLAASHSGGDLVLQLSDDGKGMDPAIIVRKAIERGLIRSESAMSEAEILGLVFEPGFSTRDSVSDLSGRGVGMDVVKRAVEALKGRIETASIVGSGTKFTIRVPLTLAVTDGMLVRVGEERFIFPTAAIRTTFRPTREMVSTIAERGEYVRVRDENVPLFRLHHVFDVPGAEKDPTRALIVVLDAPDGRVGFLVDELLGQQQVVSKALSHSILVVRGIGGGAILGDGHVGLIVDPPGLIALAQDLTAFRRAA
ncbi:MAG: chemotaxis protein CheA [Labilithrix sp.]